MDMLTVDVSDLEEVQPGDQVVVLGQQGVESWQRIDAREMAAAIGTIPWEIVCRLGTRIERQYDDQLPTSKVDPRLHLPILEFLGSWELETRYSGS